MIVIYTSIYERSMTEKLNRDRRFRAIRQTDAACYVRSQEDPVNLLTGHEVSLGFRNRDDHELFWVSEDFCKLFTVAKRQQAIYIDISLASYL